MAAVSATASAQTQLKSFNVESQSAASAIPELARQADIQILAAPMSCKASAPARFADR